MVTLAEETPFAAVVHGDHLAKVCSSCFIRKDDSTVNLARCLGCCVLYYCSKECQKKDWGNHKQECRLLKKCSARVPGALCRHIARIVFKLKEPDAHNAAFNGFRYEDLMDHREKIPKNLKRMKMFNEAEKCLQEYMGAALVPKRDVLLSIFGKISVNSLHIFDWSSIIGTGLYIGMSAQNHNCQPDAYIVYDGNKAVLRSSKAQEYSKDVTINYVNVLSTRSRQAALLDKYYFTCTSSVCSDPTRDFLENSVRSICCPDSYCLVDPNASRLSCFKCGAISEISVKQAIAANNKIRALLEKLGEAKTTISAPSPAFFVCLSKVLMHEYERHSKVLSPLNVNLHNIAEMVLYQALAQGEYEVSLEYADYILPAYRYYLSVDNPEFAAKMFFVASAMHEGCAAVDKILKIVDETQEAQLVAYGSLRQSSQLDLLKNACRIREKLHSVLWLVIVVLSFALVFYLSNIVLSN